MQESSRMNIRILDVDMASVINKNSIENLRAFMRRIGLNPENSMEKDGLTIMLKEAILEHPEYILYIHSRDALLFLMDLWESEEWEFTQADWALVGQLQLLGFLDYSMNNEAERKEGTIYLIKEAKDNFYFYLKTRQAKQEIEKYHIWERLIRGLMTFYGIISFNKLYFYFCKCLREPVDDEDFHKFLAARVSLWGFGSLVSEKNTGVEYYENFEVKAPETILDLCETDKERDYKKLDYDELLYVADNNGFGQWNGISDLADLLMEYLEVEYYQTVVILKSSILMIQNGETERHVLENILKWCPQGELFQREFYQGIRQLYRSVPLYKLKGWSREEANQGKRNKPLFTVLEGGKKDRQ